MVCCFDIPEAERVRGRDSPCRSCKGSAGKGEMHIHKWKGILRRICVGCRRHQWYGPELGGWVDVDDLDTEMDADIEFLTKAAEYFRKRDTGGEDRAYWDNVYNAVNCERIAERIKTDLRTELATALGCPAEAVTVENLKAVVEASNAVWHAFEHEPKDNRQDEAYDSLSSALAALAPFKTGG